MVGGSLAGCSGAEERDYGRTISEGQPAPKVDVEAEVRKIQANERMPEAAKQAAIASLRAGNARAGDQNKAKAK